MKSCLIRRLGLLVVAAGIAVLGLAGTAASASSSAEHETPASDVYTTGIFTLQSLASPSNPKCVGLANNGSTNNGTALVLWDCHLNPDQRWVGRDLGGSSFALVNRNSGKCVGLANNGSTNNGTALVLWDCHLNPDQRWKTRS